MVGKEAMRLAREKNRNPRLNDEQWSRYVFTDLHKIFFGEFSIILTEWLERIVENVGRYITKASRNWTREMIKKLNMVSNKFSHAIDF
jgi:hypothetical protein